MKYPFRDAEFMSAREKELALKAWVRFLKHGLRREDFTRRLYEHLHLHCGFIAHYNLLGFYTTYFENGADTVRFLSSSINVENAGRWNTAGAGSVKRLRISREP